MWCSFFSIYPELNKLISAKQFLTETNKHCQVIVYRVWEFHKILYFLKDVPRFLAKHNILWYLCEEKGECESFHKQSGSIKVWELKERNYGLLL